MESAVLGMLLRFHPLSLLTKNRKTQCAVRYCRSIEGETHVLWADAHHSSSLKASFGNIAKVLGLKQPKDKLSDPSTAVIEWLQRNNRWLLVFDNVDDLTTIQSYLPSEGRHDNEMSGSNVVSRSVLLRTRDSAMVGSEVIPFGVEVNYSVRMMQFGHLY